MKISVVVPIYNVEKYLDECINSILNQTYTDLEIILVDDGSPDNCGKMCDEYAKIDSRIIVIHQENMGVSEARNAGIRQATGEYIYFADSDDDLSPDLINLMYEALQDTKADMVVCNFNRINEEGQILKAKTDAYPTQKTIYTQQECYEILESNKFSWPILLPVWNRMIKLSIQKKYIFPKGKLMEDAMIAPYIINECETVTYIPNKLYYYRHRSNSIMNTPSFTQWMDCAYSQYERLLFYSEKNINVTCSTSLRNMIGYFIKCQNKYGFHQAKIDYNSLKKSCKKIKGYLYKHVASKEKILLFMFLYMPKTCAITIRILRPDLFL